MAEWLEGDVIDVCPTGMYQLVGYPYISSLPKRS